MRQVQKHASVGSKELTAMMTILVTAHVFLSYPRDVSRYGLEAAWMIPVLSGIAALVLFLLAHRMLSRYFQNMSIVEIMNHVLGKFLATVVTLLLGLYFLAITASIVRQFTENVISTVLPNTPILVVSGAFMLAIGYVAYCGLEGICRVAYMALPVLVIGIVLLCLLTANWWHPSFMLPFWGKGVGFVMRGVLDTSSIFLNVVLLWVIYPHAHDPKSLLRVGVQSTIWTIVLMVVFVLTYHMVFAPEETQKMTVPMYSLARVIHIGRFIQRMESFFIFMWVAVAVIKMSITLWTSAYLIAVAFNWPTYRPIIPALGLFSVSLGLVPTDVVSAGTFESVLTQWGWIIAFVLPIGVLCLGPFRMGARRRRASRA